MCFAGISPKTSCPLARSRTLISHPLYHPQVLLSEEKRESIHGRAQYHYFLPLLFVFMSPLHLNGSSRDYNYVEANNVIIHTYCRKMIARQPFRSPKRWQYLFRIALRYITFHVTAPLAKSRLSPSKINKTIKGYFQIVTPNYRGMSRLYNYYLRAG